MHHIILFLLSLFLLNGCCWWRSSPCSYQSYFSRPLPEQLEQINYPAIVDVIFGYGVELQRDKHIVLKNSCALFDVAINKIRLEFASQDIRDLQAARALLVDIVEGLLQRVNFNMAISSSLSHRPFTPEDLDITIHFESFFGLFVDTNYNGRIDMKGGLITYNTFNLYNTDRNPWGCKRETYELSRQLVTIQREIDMPYLGECVLPPHRPAGPSRERFYCQPKCPPVYDACNPMKYSPYLKCNAEYR